MVGKNIVIGIDLGTTNCCVACYSDGSFRVLENEEGRRTTPSFIFFEKQENIVVGDFARRISELKPECGIYGIKQLIGKNFNDPDVQNNLRYLPFEVTNNDNEPMIKICHEGTESLKTPQELCAQLLQKLKKDAESKLGQNVKKAVITVPAYFDIKQRELTLTAAQTAGFEVLKLLNEPTAAALSYYFQNNDGQRGHSLIYDLGGGTFDVSILKRDGSKIVITCVDGDTHLGGNDFDNLIIEYVLGELSKKNFDQKSDRRLMRRLNRESEKAKRTLSACECTSIILEGIVKGEDAIEIQLRREQFEAMSEHLFQKTIDIVERSLRRAKLSKADIKQVMLSGGSTRIPKIQQMLTAYFGKEPKKTDNQDECVAVGAAIQAAMLSTDPAQKINKMKITDVIPFPLGIKNFVHLMTVCIEKNTPIPVSKKLTRVTVRDQQSNMKFAVYEGERMDARKNRYLGTVEISNITPAPPGKCEVTFTMTVDENGILKIKAREKYRNNVKELEINYIRGLSRDVEVGRDPVDAIENKLEDEKFVRFATAKKYLLDYCEAVCYNCRKQKLCDRYRKEYNLCEKAREEGELLEVEDETKLYKLIMKVEGGCTNLVAGYKFVSMPNRKNISVLQ